MTCKTRKLMTVLFSAAVLLLAVTVASASGFLLGDSDSDGDVNVINVTCIQRVLADVPLACSFSEIAADTNQSGEIEIMDATFIQRWMVDINTPYPIGEYFESSTEAPVDLPTEPPTQEPTDDGWGHEIIRP